MLLLLSFTLVIVAFLLTAVLLHRIEMLKDIVPAVHTRLRSTPITITLVGGGHCRVGDFDGALDSGRDRDAGASFSGRRRGEASSVGLAAADCAPALLTHVLPFSQQPEFDYAQLVDAPGSVPVAHAPEIARTHGPEYSGIDPRSAPGTYALLAINIAVRLDDKVQRVPIVKGPTANQLLHFGANSADLSNQGEWWRLLSAIFVHIGIIHIATNMWCLWNLGLLGEPLLGPWGMVAVYVLTGVAGNLLSVGWDVLTVPVQYLDQMVGAGASGAVFGIAGILIVLLSNRKLPIPWVELKRLRTSVMRFAGINLVIGASTILPMLGSYVRIDNSAHIGGFLSWAGAGAGAGAKDDGRTGEVSRAAASRVFWRGLCAGARRVLGRKLQVRTGVTRIQGLKSG